jgi:hypothetical protein
MVNPESSIADTPPSADNDYSNNMSDLDYIVGDATSVATDNEDVLRQVSIVKKRLQFDEFDFRRRCKQTQSEMCAELKGKLCRMIARLKGFSYC